MHTALNDDIAFTQGAKEAFSKVVNADMGKFSVMQMLAAYCDNLLKVNEQTVLCYLSFNNLFICSFLDCREALR